MGASEGVGGEVGEEVKNALTSMRSAVETLPLAKSDASRARLLEVIEHDVKRLDRLISDISDASRLDAELQRRGTGPPRLPQLLTTLLALAHQMPPPDGATTHLQFQGSP